MSRRRSFLPEFCALSYPTHALTVTLAALLFAARPCSR
jgi:hypothetical protein